ncbi:MAG: signal recognition particle protein [Waddliaceae bacterium]|nr:signal recognition particle protein [Waddliaceae bacterium]
MLGALTEKLQGVGRSLMGKRKLSEKNISDAVREVRLALLEADVNYGVTKTFIKSVKEKVLGDEVLKAVSPGQQFIKIVHDELVALMGTNEPELKLTKKPAIILMCGLQGAGKTTQTAKLGRLLRKEGKVKRPLLVACDLQRPAAVDQLKALGKKAELEVFAIEGEKDPLKVAKAALKHAAKEQNDCLIFDTAGRLHVDEALMTELTKLKKLVQPDEVLFVANATTGQDAVKSAAEFHEKVGISGNILTMLDGSARAGAAISILEVTQRPLKFEGHGERLEDLRPFNPTSMADRILGMGDTINLVRQAEEHIDEEQAKQLEEKIRKATFTYEDYLNQMSMVKKMGSLKNLLGMLPGMSGFKDLDLADAEFAKIEAIILSMTVKERREDCELIMGRRKRIARGSGTKLDDVNRLVKSFKQAKQFFKKMPNMKRMEKMMMGGSL